MGPASSRRGWWAHALLAVLVVLTASACGQDRFAGIPPAPSTSATPTDPDIVATGLPDGTEVEVADTAPGAENGENLDFVSPVYTVTPLGPLDADAKVTLRLDNALPPDTPVLVATRQQETDPWAYQPGRLTSDQRHVEFATRSLDQVGVLAIDVAGLTSGFGSDLQDALVPRKHGKIVKPSCPQGDAARESGYAARSTPAKTLSWCLDLSQDKRVLRVTNRRPVPVQLSHPGVDVVAQPEAVAAYATWSQVLGDGEILLAPGRTATFDAELAAKSKKQVVATTSTEAQTLRLFLAGTRALVHRLNAFGTQTAKVAPTVRTLLTPPCQGSLARGADAMVAHCFSLPRLVKVFGPGATMLAPLVTSEAFPALFVGQGQALATRATAQRQRVVVRRSAPDFRALTGLWSGTSRLLAVNGQGLATEKVYSKDGKLAIQLTYQVDYPTTKNGTTTAATKITAVKLGKPKPKGAAPKVGAAGTITVRKGVISSPYRKASYCDAKAAKKGTCGKQG